METFEAIFNTVLVVFIVSTMLSAGFNTTIEQITGVLTKVGLVAGVVVVGFVVRPPFGAKLVMTAKADLQSGAVLQVLLAAIGSITFAPTANAIISAADLGSDVSLPVGDLIKTVAVLQLVPFAVGILTRTWAAERAAALIQPCTNSGPAFAAVAIAFDNDPEILGAITAILIMQIIVGLVSATFFARDADDIAEATAA